MMTKQSSIDAKEVKKFAALQHAWWDTEGELKTLHHINSARLEFIKEHTDLKGKHLLDVGCGGGILSESLQKEGAVVTGIDAAKEVIEVAKNHALREGLSIQYHATPLEDYPLEMFDVITCMEMLEHVPHPEMIILECSKRLKEGGYLFLSTINRTAQAYLSAIIAAEYILGLLPRQTHDYSRFMKPSEMARMARSAGLEVVALKGFSYEPFSGISKLQDSVSVNYLMACRKL